MVCMQTCIVSVKFDLFNIFLACCLPTHLFISPEQINYFQAGATLALHNARVDMFRQQMYLTVDRWGVIELAATPLEGAVDVANNRSDDVYELVPVASLA